MGLDCGAMAQISLRRSFFSRLRSLVVAYLSLLSDGEKVVSVFVDMSDTGSHMTAVDNAAAIAADTVTDVLGAAVVDAAVAEAAVVDAAVFDAVDFDGILSA